MSTKRRDFLQLTGSAVLMLLLAPQLLSCKTGTGSSPVIDQALSFIVPPGVDYKLNHVGGNVWTFVQRGGTIGVYASKDGICVIDTQFPTQAENLINQIKSISERKIDVLINTHHHGDHTAGNSAFEGLINTHVTHTNAIANQIRSAKENKQEGIQVYASTLFDTEWSSKLGAETVRMNYYGAGHTNGDAVTTFENANVVHMGDLVFNRRFPFIDKSAGANITNWVSILDQVIKDHNTETKYIFGHSDGGFPITGTQEDLRAFQNYLEKLLVFGAENIKAGKTLEEIKASTRGIPGAEEWRGRGVDRSLDAVYEELG